METSLQPHLQRHVSQGRMSPAGVGSTRPAALVGQWSGKTVVTACIPLLAGEMRVAAEGLPDETLTIIDGRVLTSIDESHGARHDEELVELLREQSLPVLDVTHSGSNEEEGENGGGRGGRRAGAGRAA